MNKILPYIAMTPLTVLLAFLIYGELMLKIKHKELNGNIVGGLILLLIIIFCFAWGLSKLI